MSDQEPQTQTPPKRIPVFHVLLAVTIGLLVWFLLFHAQPEQLPYGLFRDLLEEGHIKSGNVSSTMITGRFDRVASRESLTSWREREKALVARSDDSAKEKKIDGETKTGGENKPDAEAEDDELRRGYTPPFSGVSEESYPYIVMRGDNDDDIVQAMRDKGAMVDTENQSSWLLLLFMALLIFGSFLLLWMFMMRRGDAYGQQVLTFGKSKARVVAVTDTKTSFDDVAGCDEAKEELGEVVAFLQDPARFQKLGGAVPKGVLLMGSPGTGKTLMARAIAGEAKVPFFSLSGSDFVEMFVGVGAARVRDLFQQAKNRAPCIVFIDEIDAVGRQRGVGLGGGNDEREQTLNQLLAEMDGFEPNAGVIVLAATNRPDVLDSALLRPGRFDRRVVIDNADVRGREQILRVHSRGKPLAKDVDLTRVAKRTPGFSGADLANILNESALLAARRNKDEIGMAEVDEAIERVMAGPERRSKLIGPREKEIIAYHETGHALVSYFTPRSDRVHKISIVPRGHAALGYTLQLPSEDRYIMQRAELVDRMCVLLGGRIAEEIIFGDSSTGAADDLEKVTDLARSMVCRWGMSPELGPIIFEKERGSSFVGQEGSESRNRFSNETLERIDNEVHELANNCYDRTRKILEDNRDLLDRLAAELIELEVMEGYQFADIIKEVRGDLAPESTSGYHRPGDVSEESKTAEVRAPGEADPVES